MTLSLSTSAHLELVDEASDSERRRGLRIRQQRPVKIFEPRTGRYFGGQTGDISNTGLRIELPAYVPVRQGQVLNIHVGLNNSGQSLANRRQMIPSRIVWINHASTSTDSTIEAGVEFLSGIAAHLDAA